MQRPQPMEYNPYFQNYIGMVAEGEYLQLLRNNTVDVTSFFEQVPVEKHNYSYAENKWTIKEVLLHIIDTERIMSHRAFVTARGAKDPMYSMDIDLYAANMNAKDRTMESLLKEFKAVRSASDTLFEQFDEQQTTEIGSIEGINITPRALGYIIIGHSMHHLNIMRERYL